MDIKTEIKEPKTTPEVPSSSPLSSLTLKQISPALQETDTTLLEEAISSVSQSEILTKLDETKDIGIKTGTKIADSLLQKFSMIKSATENKFIKEETDSDEEPLKPPDATEVKNEPKIEITPIKEESKLKIEPKIKPSETKAIKPDSKLKIEPKLKTIEPKPKTSDSRFKTIESKIRSMSAKPEATSEMKKRSRKIVSREFIEESDTDSTDSEERLVIARSDEESQTNSSSDVKLDLKETTNSNPATVEEPQSVQSECSFKFDVIKKSDQESIKPEVKIDMDSNKEEEPDSHLHSLLLCEETIPGSPAPAPEGPVTESRQKNKSVLEMPFASAPGSSNNKSEVLTRENKIISKERTQPPPLSLPLDNRDKDGRGDTSTVLDNTPPTTPESTLSNLSPRGYVL